MAILIVREFYVLALFNCQPLWLGPSFGTCTFPRMSTLGFLSFKDDPVWTRIAANLNMKILKKMWDSPTLMTWGSFLSRSVSMLVVLPLLLTRFSTEEIALWYLFITLIGFQMFADLGFSPTFSRVVAYAMGGATVCDLKRPSGICSGNPNRESLERIFATMLYLYARLGFGWIFILGIFGTLALKRPIGLLSSPVEGWIAWGIIVIFSLIVFRGNIYAALLLGTNRVALVRRVEILISICSVGTMAILLILECQFFVIVAGHQLWRGFNVFLNWWFATKTIKSYKIVMMPRGKKDYQVLSAVWPSAWRSGLGSIMSYGVIQGSGIVYAQLAPTEMVATYLLSLRLLEVVSQFSQAPFYSKLPVMAKCFAEGRLKELLNIAQRGMCWSYWAYLVGFIGLGLMGPLLLREIGSNADFPPLLLWNFLGFGFFVSRYGAMHIQLYSTTNHIVWHTVTGISGTIFLLVSIITFPFLGVYAFPTGILAAYLGFYSWFSSLYSYREFKLNFFKFEKNAVILPLLTVIIYLLFTKTIFIL